MQELARNKRGLESDTLLLKTIQDYPGLSQYELTQKLRWHSGRVDGAIRRLVNEKLIVIKGLERNGRTVNLIYPKDTKPPDIIEVPTNLLQFENGEWLNCAFVYALDSTTIGIAGQEIAEWSEISCFSEEIPIKKENGKIIMQIPFKLARFYKIGRKHRTVSVGGNTVLITISGNIVEAKKYPA
jgi:hypothetical protein